MIGSKDKNIIIDLARLYKATKVYLFGSSVNKKSEDSNDIDLIVSGIEPEVFYEFYARLFAKLSKPVDLIDFNDNLRFTELALKDSVLLYEQSA